MDIVGHFQLVINASFNTVCTKWKMIALSNVIHLVLPHSSFSMTKKYLKKPTFTADGLDLDLLTDQ